MPVILKEFTLAGDQGDRKGEAGLLLGQVQSGEEEASAALGWLWATIWKVHLTGQSINNDLFRAIFLKMPLAETQTEGWWQRQED